MQPVGQLPAVPYRVLLRAVQNGDDLDQPRSAGKLRCAGARRRMFASAIASAWSDFARATRWRSRYRATAIGLIEYTFRPVVRRHEISKPRAVSTATGTGSRALSPASASSSSSRR